MHNAPSVVYPLGRSRFQARVLLGLWLSGVVVLILWWRTAPGLGWRLGLGLAAVVAAGAAAAWGWRNSPVGQLRWDGQVWSWEAQGEQAGTAARALTVALDFQRILLLRLENHDDASLWLWVGRRAMPERWLDLRRAVYSRRKLWPEATPLDISLSAAVDAAAEPPSPRLSS